ncbi:hypothetical protein [Collimonas fungivorans]|uniref:hypothetical protein n=1 Tax=Collimonas fungivorans TaxID=158899 RepID=UPI0005A12540|nr:hypothetical protein [Collimonas fungivorans]
MSKPDFKEIFFSTFKSESAGIHYSVRSDSNFQHDIHFLDSLLKDSRFLLGHIKHTKQTLVIPLTRARWELRDEVTQHNLVEIESELKFTRVKKLQWIAKNVTLSAPYEGNLFEPGDAITDSTRCEIDSLFIGESTYIGKNRSVEIVIAGYPGRWQLRVSLALESWSISVKDNKVPPMISVS